LEGGNWTVDGGIAVSKISPTPLYPAFVSEFPTFTFQATTNFNGGLLQKRGFLFGSLRSLEKEN
jgi:hypothetical protein